MKSYILTALLVAGVAIGGSPASAERLRLIPGNLHSDENAIRKFFSENEDTKHEFVSDAAVNEGEIKFSLDHVLIGRADIDSDGVPELFLMIDRSAYCGTVGCSGYVLKYVGSTLKVIAWLSVDNDRIELPTRPITVQINTALPSEHCRYIPARVPPFNAGVRTFHTYIGGYYWNGQQFVLFCLDRCGHECG
jgi:hypothetical protein